MKAEERIDSFHLLGRKLAALPEDEFQSLALSAKLENPWFTVDNVRMSVRSIISWLDAIKLLAWTAIYNLQSPPKRVAVVMAGNIPLVGFHDFLCVLICGHHILIKMSSKDTVLMRFFINTLIDIEPRFNVYIQFAERLKEFDAIIATGSDNTSRYFEYYFGKYQHIIRKNRTSIAIIDGRESTDRLASLGTDVFSYFGMGCRNVAKVFLPEGYKINVLLDSWKSFQDIIHHHKYCNNYDYQKSVLLVTIAPFLDTGFVLLQESESLFSPLSVLYFEYYKDRDSLTKRLSAISDKIQCIVSDDAASGIKFGQSQSPGLGDYADQIDTMKFVTTLS